MHNLSLSDVFNINRGSMLLIVSCCSVVKTSKPSEFWTGAQRRAPQG